MNPQEHKKLITAIDTLTKQLTEVKEKAMRLVDTKIYLIDVIAAARQISPEVSARIDEIMEEVKRSYNQTKENDRLSAQARAQEPTMLMEETQTPIHPESHSLYDPQPVQTLRYWIIKSRHDNEYFYLRSKENLVIEPSWINDKLCVSGVTHATLVPEYLGLQMQLEYKGDFNLDFDVTIVENSVEEDETHVFFFYPLSVVGSDKSPEEMGARWASMVKNFDRYGNPNYRYREWGLVDGKKKLVFERVFPCVHPLPTLPMDEEKPTPNPSLKGRECREGESGRNAEKCPVP